MNSGTMFGKVAVQVKPTVPVEVRRVAEIPAKIKAEEVNFYYGKTRALHSISLQIKERQITAFIGPSGCGKSTFLRTLNRMNDLIPATRLEGKVFIDGQDIYAKAVDPILLRRKVGMIFQKSNPFPKSIYENVVYGVKINSYAKNRREMGEIVEKSLHDAALWDEVKDRLHRSAFSLSGGQQQRLCIARALAVGPQVLLIDEAA